MGFFQKVKDWWTEEVPDWDLTKSRDPGRHVGPPMTTFDPLAHEAGILDTDGSYWGLRKQGDLIYLSGDDGLVQATFRADSFKDWARFGHEIATDG